VLTAATLWACTQEVPGPDVIEVKYYSETFIAALPRRIPGRHLEIGHDHLLSTETLGRLDIREVAGSNMGKNEPEPAFHGGTHSLQVNVGTVTRIIPQLLPSTSLPIHYSLIILTSDVIQSQLQTVSLS
jgi:hypothetical protein